MAGKSQKSAGKAKVKVDKLKLNKETVKELTDRETRGVKGGWRTDASGLGPTCACSQGTQCKTCPTVTQ
jgi:hypothetical protein